MTTLSQEQLKEWFNYHSDGYLVWAVSRGKAKSGKKAGMIHKNGYLRTGINGKVYSNHRLIYIWHYGKTSKFIDHIDGNPLNNKIDNLREANAIENQQNAKLSVKNTSGYKNVTLCPQTKKWAVKLRVDGKIKTVGRYNDIELANLVAIEARDKYHGKYARNM